MSKRRAEGEVKSEVQAPSPKRAKPDSLASPKPSSSQQHTSLRQLLASPVSLVLQQHPHGVCTLYHNQTVAEALEELANKQILSAPVLLSASAEDREGDTYLGMVDVGELVSWLAKESEKGTDPKTLQKEFLEKRLIVFLGSDVDMLFEANVNATLHDAIRTGFLQLPADGDSKKDKSTSKDPHVHGKHVHRIAIFDAKGHIHHILSQSDVIQFVERHLTALGNLHHKTVKELGFVRNDVIAVSNDTSLLSAFSTIAKHHVTAVALIDKHGKLVGNLSASDLRGFTADDLKLLNTPVHEFLSGKHKNHEQRPLSVGPNDTLETVIKLIVKHRVHRVYVTDNCHMPCGVITLSDLLRLLATAADAEPPLPTLAQLEGTAKSPQLAGAAASPSAAAKNGHASHAHSNSNSNSHSSSSASAKSSDAMDVLD